VLAVKRGTDSTNVSTRICVVSSQMGWQLYGGSAFSSIEFNLALHISRNRDVRHRPNNDGPGWTRNWKGWDRTAPMPFKTVSSGLAPGVPM
jgi:hypothetical protein